MNLDYGKLVCVKSGFINSHTTDLELTRVWSTQQWIMRGIEIYIVTAATSNGNIVFHNGTSTIKTVDISSEAQDAMSNHKIDDADATRAAETYLTVKCSDTDATLQYYYRVWATPTFIAEDS